jgi:hypothetical protein
MVTLFAYATERAPLAMTTSGAGSFRQNDTLAPADDKTRAPTCGEGTEHTGKSLAILSIL